MKGLRTQTKLKQIICIVAAIILCNFIMPNNVFARNDTNNGGSIFDPFIKFTVHLSDTIMQYMQNTFTSSQSIDNGDGTYNFQYSPAIIFSGKVQGLDINFITPNTDERNTNNFDAYLRAKKSEFIAEVEQEEDMETKSNQPSPKLDEKYTNKLDEYKNKDGAVKFVWENDSLFSTFEPNYFAYYYEEDNILKMCIFKYHITSADSGHSVKYVYCFKEVTQELTEDFFKEANAATTYTSIASELQPTIATWYNALRKISLVGLLSVLLYLGIRIILSSSSAEGNSKYKKMLTDWLVALCLLFTLHYLMSLIMLVTQKLPELFTLGETDELMNSLRKNIYDAKTWGEVLTENIMYIVLVVYTVVFTFQYLRRVLYMAFFTMIAPLITLTYPLDKVSDGQAQAFNMWLKEYIFNALVQIIHLVVYYTLVGSAMELVKAYPIYAVIAIGFMTQGEKIIRSMFGFNNTNTVGTMQSAVAGGLIANALGKLKKMPKGGKPGGGSEKESGSSGNVRTATNNPLGTGQGNAGKIKGNRLQGAANIGKEFLKNHGKGIASGVIGAGTGFAGGMIGLAGGIAQGDIGAAISGAIAGGTAGMNLSKNLVNSVTSIPGRYRRTVNSIKDTYREGAYGEEVAKAMRFDEDFRKGSTYEAIKNNGNFSEEKLQTMLNAGITDKKEMTKILDSGMDVDSAIKYSTLAKNCPEEILYDKKMMKRFCKVMKERESSFESQSYGKIRDNIKKFM